LIDEAVAAGSRRAPACALLGLSVRTVERWRGGALDDRRQGPNTVPSNKLTSEERSTVIATANSPEFRDLSPNQIVPRLADKGRYIASESTMYRILREEKLLQHRGRSKPPERRPPAAHVANGPNQVWSWDITYLRSPVAGAFFYLYLVVDVWSRKIVAAEVHAAESGEFASALIKRTCSELGLDSSRLILHSDNGGPMKGATMAATLERLGITASYSRPRVSDDNPFSEALFRTLKYRPEYPAKPFADIAAARAWVAEFTRWYNTAHLHSGIRFVSPEERHSGRERALLAQRHEVYQQARAARPDRWSRNTRNWKPVELVYLNPDKTVGSELPTEPTRGLGPSAPAGLGGAQLEQPPKAVSSRPVIALVTVNRSAGHRRPLKENRAG